MVLILAGSDYLSTVYDQKDLEAGKITGPVSPSAFDFGEAMGLVELESKPFGFGNCDTIRKRNEDAHLPVNGSKTTIEIEWTLVSIGSKNPIELNDQQYDVKIMLTPGLRSLGKMYIVRDDKDGIIGGSFTSSILVKFSAIFINKNESTQSIIVNSEVLMNTRKEGYWGVNPHRENYFKISSLNNPKMVSNFKENLLPDMYNFHQAGALFEGSDARGGMVTSAVIIEIDRTLFSRKQDLTHRPDSVAAQSSFWQTSKSALASRRAA